MKKLITVCLVLLLALCVFTACDESHEHVYDQKNVGDAYLKSEATATEPATYYYSCKCGEKGNETFSFGNPIGDVDPEDGVHVFRNEWTYDDDKHWCSCIDLSCDARKNEANHTFGEWVVDEAATCAKAGTRHHTCVVCGKSVSETILVDPTAHNYATTWTSDDTNHWRKCQNYGCTSVDMATHSGDSICSVCSMVLSLGNSTYIRVDAEGKKDAGGSYILFGEYPQTLKAESVTVGTTTDSRGYYLGSDGFYYAKVTADPYNSGYTFSSGASVVDGTVYYFKVEPIRWRILSESGGNALILCDSIIANKRFDGDSNNYKESEIRAWLNGTFYSAAFDDLQKALVNTVTVDNSVASTGYSKNQYACEDTSDKVFLLSYAEVTNADYGFSSNDRNYDTTRRKQVSDYARAMGAYMSTSESYYGNGWWWLRSPGYYRSDLAREVGYGGSVYHSDYYVYYTYDGVVPALQIRLN